MSEICLLLTSWACLEKESALAIMAALLSSSSPSFCPLSSRAIRARARSPTTPDAAPFMPSMLPGPGMCWARLREALPAAVSPTVKFVFFLITKDQMEKVMCYSTLQARNVWMWNQSVLTEILPVQRLSSSTKKTFKKTPVWSLRCLHRGK